MLYAKLKQDGSLDRFPYSLTDLRRDHPNTSFPQTIDHETALEFGAVPVQSTPAPAQDHTTNLERSAVLQGGQWVEVWTSVPASTQEVAERTAAMAQSVRAQRDSLLAACDWTQLADVLQGDPLKTSWAHYRQALRDVPEQAGFPFSVSWPVAPG